MKVIAIGDPHFQTDNIPEVNLFIEKLILFVEKEKPDFIVVLGDVLHTHERLHTLPLNKAYEFIDKLRKISKTFVLVGNHDYIQNQQFLTTNHWMNGMKEWENVTIVDTVINYKINNLHFVFCPYVPPGRFQDALNTSKEDWKNADCIFAHQEFQGCKMGAIISVEGDDWPEEYPYVLSGHIHSRQIPQENIYYCGSSMQHAFGESEKNIIPLVEWNNKKERNVIEKDLELPRKKIVYTDVQDMEDYTVPQTQDKIKITVSGVYEEFKSFKKTKKYKDIIKTGTKVVFKPKKIKVDEENKDFETVKEGDFHEILNSLINKEENTFLKQVFDMVVHDRVHDRVNDNFTKIIIEED